MYPIFPLKILSVFLSRALSTSRMGRCHLLQSRKELFSSPPSCRVWCTRSSLWCKQKGEWGPTVLSLLMSKAELPYEASCSCCVAVRRLPRGESGFRFLPSRPLESACCRERGPFQGLRVSCLALRNELSKETHGLTREETL